MVLKYPYLYLEGANCSTLLTGVPGVRGAEARRGGGDVEANKEEDPRRDREDGEVRRERVELERRVLRRHVDQ